jgi:hypothetical protein
MLVERNGDARLKDKRRASEKVEDKLEGEGVNEEERG